MRRWGSKMRSSRFGAAVAVLAAAGILVAGYLSWHKVIGEPLWCAGGSSCDVVNASSYSYFFGIPVAYLGLAAYMALLGLGLAWRRAGDQTPAWVPLAAAGVATIGWIFSAYLTYLEAYVIYAYCIWCLASFAIITGLAVAAIWGAQRHTGG